MYHLGNQECKVKNNRFILTEVGYLKEIILAISTIHRIKHSFTSEERVRLGNKIYSWILPDIIDDFAQEPMAPRRCSITFSCVTIWYQTHRGRFM